MTADGEALLITIPPRRRWLDMFFLAPALLLFVIGASSALFLIVQGIADRDPSDFVVTGISVVIAVTTAVVAYALVWRIAGTEVVRAMPGTLIVTQQMLGLQHSYAFELTHIRDLRATGPAVDWGAVGLGAGTMAFDYGAKTHRFGLAIDEAEARVLVAAIKRACNREGDTSLATPSSAPQSSPTA